MFNFNLLPPMKKNLLLTLLLICAYSGLFPQINNRVVIGYFPSWSEDWATTNQNSKLREIPPFVNYVFLSFAKPNLTYTKGSYDLTTTGIQTPYDGCALKESVSALAKKGIKVILSIGGETFWNDASAYNINYQAIKDLVDDIGFVGIDWDYEPDGSFSGIGNAQNVQHFIDFFNNSRALMPKSKGYILACAPSGVGALGGQTNDDPSSPYKYANRNSLTGESDANLYNSAAACNGINLFGFSATGHMIPVIKSVGDKIDIIAYQGYNCGASTNRKIMYEAFAYYAEQYGFVVAAGVHYPNEPWGPYYEYTHQNVASLSAHISQFPSRTDNMDGIMIWQLLMSNSSLNSSAYSYMHVGSKVLNGQAEATAIQNANNFSMATYTGGAEGCGTNGGNTYCGAVEYNASASYPNPNTKVYYKCKTWHNQWYANANEIPGVNGVWVYDADCPDGPGCGTTSVGGAFNKQPEILFSASENEIRFLNASGENYYSIHNALGDKLSNGVVHGEQKLSVAHFSPGVYLILLNNQNTYKLVKH